MKPLLIGSLAVILELLRRKGIAKKALAELSHSDTQNPDAASISALVSLRGRQDAAVASLDRLPTDEPTPLEESPHNSFSNR